MEVIALLSSGMRSGRESSRVVRGGRGLVVNWAHGKQALRQVLAVAARAVDEMPSSEESEGGSRDDRLKSGTFDVAMPDDRATAEHEPLLVHTVSLTTEQEVFDFFAPVPRRPTPTCAEAFLRSPYRMDRDADLIAQIKRTARSFNGSSLSREEEEEEEEEEKICSLTRKGAGNFTHTGHRKATSYIDLSSGYLKQREPTPTH